MNQKSSARPPDHGILKKELFGYAGICLVLLLLLGTGERLFDTFPVQGMLSALCYLFVGGLGMSAGMFRFRPEAAASFLEKAGIAVVHVTENLHLVYIAGWTFLVAGMIVLVVILRGSRM